MRRPSGLVLSCLLLLTLGGCVSLPPSVDRNLADDWPTFDVPAVPVPAAGACYTTTARDVDDMFESRLTRSACDSPHAAETFHVGTFTGPATHRTMAVSSTAERAEVYNLCTTATKEFLGDDWRTGRLHLLTFTPSNDHWAAGARWYRCDLVQVKSQMGMVVDRIGSLKDGLRGARSLAMGCATEVNATDAGADDHAEVPCTQPHTVEFAGLATTPATAYPEESDASTALFQVACRAVTARYVGMTPAQLESSQISWAWWVVRRDRWSWGDHSAQCFVAAPKPITISLRGYGNRRLP